MSRMWEAGTAPWEPMGESRPAPRSQCGGVACVAPANERGGRGGTWQGPRRCRPPWHSSPLRRCSAAVPGLWPGQFLYSAGLRFRRYSPLVLPIYSWPAGSSKPAPFPGILILLLSSLVLVLPQLEWLAQEQVLEPCLAA